MTNINFGDYEVTLHCFRCLDKKKSLAGRDPPVLVFDPKRLKVAIFFSPRSLLRLNPPPEHDLGHLPHTAGLTDEFRRQMGHGA